jgi:hypothetical protein
MPCSLTTHTIDPNELMGLMNSVATVLNELLKYRNKKQDLEILNRLLSELYLTIPYQLNCLSTANYISRFSWLSSPLTLVKECVQLWTHYCTGMASTAKQHWSAYHGFHSYH